MYPIYPNYTKSNKIIVTTITATLSLHVPFKLYMRSEQEGGKQIQDGGTFSFRICKYLRSKLKKRQNLI